MIDYEELIVQGTKYVRGRVAQMLRRYGDEVVEDIVQEAALKAWKHRKSFAGRSAFNSWFTRIAINEALMYLRRRKFITNGDDHNVSIDAFPEYYEMDIEDRHLDPERRLLREERREALVAAVLRLRPEQRREILLSQTQLIGHRDSDPRRGINSRTRKSLRHRAYVNLRLEGLQRL